MSSCYMNLKTHASWSTHLNGQIQSYLKKSTLKKNLAARLTFVAITIVSLAEAILTLGAAFFFTITSLLSFRKIRILQKMSKEFWRIAIYNSILVIGGLIGSIYHPVIGSVLVENANHTCYKLFRKNHVMN